MYNLNKGKNDELLSKCKVLSDYMTLINYIRENQSCHIELREAVDRAVKRCIDEGVLEEFLIKHRSEVLDVCITEFNEKVFVNGLLKEGIEKGKMQEVFESVECGDYSIDRGAQKLQLSVAEFCKKMEEEGFKLPAHV